MLGLLLKQLYTLHHFVLSLGILELESDPALDKLTEIHVIQLVKKHVRPTS